MLSLCSQAGTILWASFPENVDIISGWGSRHFSCLSSENKQAILLHTNFQFVLHGSLPWICGLFQKQSSGCGEFRKGLPATHTIFTESKESVSVFFYFTVSCGIDAYLRALWGHRAHSEVRGKKRFCVVPDT